MVRRLKPPSRLSRLLAVTLVVLATLARGASALAELDPAVRQLVDGAL